MGFDPRHPSPGHVGAARTSGSSEHPPSDFPLGLLAALVALAGAVAAGLVWIEELPPAMVVHATVLITVWAGMLPAGAIIARYDKVTPRQPFPDAVDNRFWWNWHRGLQYAGVALSLAGLAAILGLTGGTSQTTHGLLGLFLVLLSVAQVVGAALRGTKGGPTDTHADPARPETWRGDHFDMTLRRRVWERAHKALGWSMIGVSCAVIALGIQLVGSPGWLIAVVVAAYAIVLLAVAARIRRGGRVDTYAAIWGPDLKSPLIDPGQARRPPRA